MTPTLAELAWGDVGKVCDCCGHVFDPRTERPHQIRELSHAGYLVALCYSCALFAAAPGVVRLMLRVLARYSERAKKESADEPRNPDG